MFILHHSFSCLFIPLIFLLSCDETAQMIQMIVIIQIIPKKTAAAVTYII
jgi:hypothetical protein